MVRIALTVVLFLVLAVPARAGFNEGLAAFKRGHYATAYREFEKLAKQGNAAAQANLGIMYRYGRGVERDDAEAIKWFKKAAARGNATAQGNLGLMYGTGRGVAQDFAEAAKWYRRAAEQGNVAAQANLGFMYINGQGVAQDYGEALKLSRRAAAHGNAAAQMNLASLYESGRGVAPDFVKAHKWYNLAAARLPPGKDHDRAVANRDVIERKMTPAQLATAQRQARNWRPQAQPIKRRAAPKKRKPDPRVARVQRRLAALGYKPGRADGLMGAKTRSAIRAFQAKHRRPVTGELSASLEAAIRAANSRR